MSFRTAPRCLFKHRFSFWLLPFCRFHIPPEKSALASRLHQLTHVFPVGTKSAQPLGCQTVSILQRENRGTTGCRSFQRILPTPCRLPPPLLLWDELLNSRRGWLFDSLKIYQSSLPSCPWPLKLQAVGDLRGGKKLTNDFSGLCQLTALAGCQQRECNIICSKLPAHTKWHKAV